MFIHLMNEHSFHNCDSPTDPEPLLRDGDPRIAVCDKNRSTDTLLVCGAKVR